MLTFNGHVPNGTVRGRGVDITHHVRKESITCASFCPSAWTRARRATDRDLESAFTSRKVNAWICASRQPTVIFRVSACFGVNAWICARRATDRDLESVNAMKKVNAWICAPLTTDHDLESASAIEKKGECLDMCTADKRP